MIHYEIILVATLALTVWFRFNGREPFPYFLFFMTMVVFTELFVEPWYVRKYQNNFPVMNLYSKFCIYYYLFVFYTYFKDRTWHKTLLIIFIGYTFFTLTWNFFFHNHQELDYLSYNLGFLILVPLILRYLYEVVYIKPYYNVFRDPYFYFTFGLLIFYTAAFPILGFLNILITNNPEYEAYRALLDAGNVFLSLTYLFSLLCLNIRIPSTT